MRVIAAGVGRGARCGHPAAGPRLVCGFLFAL